MNAWFAWRDSQLKTQKSVLKRRVFNNSISHNTETTSKADSNTSVTKSSNVHFATERSKEIETDLSNNTDKINPKSENKQVIRKNNGIKTPKSVIILGDSVVKHINGWEISKCLQSHCKVYVK